ncbi:MAG: cupin domain-containing protein [Desulfobulbaceae bacterium]|nr:cupin domain-containing protein [Desulfobulbaceae bacterium]
MSFVKIEDLPELEITKGIRARAVTTDTISVVHVMLDNGAILPEHSHYNEQVVNVVEGELELTVSGEKFNLKPGNVMVLEPNIVHSGKALTACKVIDIFHPLRKDFAGLSFGGYSGDEN